MAKFMCKRSGNTVEFTSEYDIQEMRKHPEYVEVEDEEKTPRKKIVVVKKQTNKED